MLSTGPRGIVKFKMPNIQIRQMQNLECVKKAARQEVVGGSKVSSAVSKPAGHPHLSLPLLPHRERPAAISIEIKSIDDTSNFDDFPESDILQPGSLFFSKLSAQVILELQCSGENRDGSDPIFYFLKAVEDHQPQLDLSVLA